jgi:hypothetical protein
VRELQLGHADLLVEEHLDLLLEQRGLLVLLVELAHEPS